MPIKWKKRSGLNPQAILDKIESIKSVNKEGRVSYSGFEYHEAFASLFSMLEIPQAISNELNIDSLVSRGLGKAASEGILTLDSVAKSLNAVANAELSTKQIEYRLLTSLSLSAPLPFKKIDLDGSKIRFIGEQYPKKYSSRDIIIQKNRTKTSSEHPGYRKVIVSAKAKSFQAAASKALNALDISRAILSMFSNSGMELMGDPYSPINKIRLGQAHTLHLKSGNHATEMFWYEPNFQETMPFHHNKPDQLEKNFKFCLEKLSSSPYHLVIKDALLRYVRALDENDPNTAAIRIWGAMETLASPNEARYDRIIKRCSFLFDEEEYHRQLLEHLREFRNRTVHSGDQSEKAKTFCFQLQFYFRQLILFHLGNASHFDSLDEANDFLDLPADSKSLLSKQKQILKALEFRGIKL